MAVTNWAAGAAGGAYEADMERKKLALQAQAQADEQKRWEAEREDKNRQYEDAKQWREKTYADSRGDVNYNRNFEREKWDTQRGDVNYNRNFEREKWDTQRGDVNYNRNFEREKYQDKLYQDDFDNELKLEKHKQATALFDSQMAEYNRLTEEREAKEKASKTSLAAMLAYGIRNGDRDSQGRIFIPKDAMNVFNRSLAQATGVNNPGYLGAVLITKDANGNPLNHMQVALLMEGGGTKIIPQNELVGLEAAFPSFKEEYEGLRSQLFPQQQEQRFNKDYYNYLTDKVDQSTKTYNSLLSGTDTNPERREAARAEVERSNVARDIFMKTGRAPTEEEVEFTITINALTTKLRKELGRAPTQRELEVAYKDAMMTEEEREKQAGKILKQGGKQTVYGDSDVILPLAAYYEQAKQK